MPCCGDGRGFSLSGLILLFHRHVGDRFACCHLTYISSFYILYFYAWEDCVLMRT